MKLLFSLFVCLSFIFLSCGDTATEPQASSPEIVPLAGPPATDPVAVAPLDIKLLQGKWQHTEDKTNFLTFEGNHRKEIAAGMDKPDDEVYVLSDKCMNAGDKDRELPAEKDRYISCVKSDLCWYIVDLTEQTLTLSFMGPGNTLAYTRAK
jgi:hypothetical protein